MKGISEDPNKPKAVMVPPKAAKPANPLEAADDQEALERIRRQAELDQRNAAKMNRVAGYLDQSYYITDWTHPVLYFGDRQVSVTEFYPAINVAIDKFFHIGDWEKQLTDAKREALKSIGVKYAFLTPGKSLADLEPELGL